MLSNQQIEKLEIIEQWLEEINESPELAELDIYPDLTIGDSLQGVKEMLTAHYPVAYVPPKPTKYLYKPRQWHEKLKDRTYLLLSDISGAMVISAAFSVCCSFTFWGLSDIKAAFGNRQQPDFAAQSQIYRGVSLSLISTALGCGIICSVIKQDK